jgi:hypothetical protein
LINVSNTYKLIDILIDGEYKTVRINPSDAWGVMEVETEDGVLTVNEGDKINLSLKQANPNKDYLQR